MTNEEAIKKIENGEGIKKKGRPSKDDKYSSDTNNVNELKYIIARKDSKIKALEMEVELMEEIGKKRGCLVRGGEVDYTKVANIILDDFRTGKIGLITLE